MSKVSYLINNDCPVIADKRGVKIEDDVDEEGQVNDGVDDQERDVIIRQTSIERQVVGHHHYWVERQA